MVLPKGDVEENQLQTDWAQWPPGKLQERVLSSLPCLGHSPPMEKKQLPENWFSVPQTQLFIDLCFHSEFRVSLFASVAAGKKNKIRSAAKHCLPWRGANGLFGGALSLLSNYQWSREESGGDSCVGNWQAKAVSVTEGAVGPSVPHIALWCLPQFCGLPGDTSGSYRSSVKPGRWHRALGRDGAQERALAQSVFWYKLSFNPACVGNATDLSKVPGGGGSAEQQLSDHCPRVIISPWFIPVYFVLKELLCLFS